MIEGGLAPFETPFFFILIDPSKGSWRQLAAAGPFFWALRPCLAARGDLCGAGSPCTSRYEGAPREYGLAMLGAPAYFLA